jgi:Big-like domain-containing protein
MTYTHRLSRRLALLRAAAAVAVLAVVASCDILSLSDTSALTVAQVVVVPGSTTLETEQNYQFAGYGRTNTGDSVAVAVVWSATGGTISSSGRYIADTVQGDFEVRATLANAAALSGSSVVRVRKLAQLLVTPASATLPTRGTQAFGAYGRLNGGDSVAVTVTWSATGGSISSAGLYTAGPTPGAYTVTATRRSLNAGATATLTSIPVASVSVSPPSATLSLGATQQLSAVTKDSAGNTLTGRVVTWSSSNPTVATVSVSGLGTAIAAGSATITATSEGKNGTSAITVQAPPPVSHAGYYVAPTGSPIGDGSAARPWDLATALARPLAVQPGDTIWLRGGTYTYQPSVLVSSLTGTAARPIIVRQYPGERATIDGRLLINGAYTWYWGFEVANTNLSAPWDIQGLDVRAPGAKLINLVIHDHSGNGIGIWEPAPNSEVVGCLLYNNGFHGANGLGSAHGIYNQNITGYRLLKDNIIYNTYSYDFNLYGSAGHEENVTVEGNVFWGTGEGMLLKTQSASSPSNDVIQKNMVYKPPSHTVGGFNLGSPLLDGYQNESLWFLNNYVASQGGVTFSNWTQLTVTGNTFAIAPEQRFQAHGSSTFPPAPGTVWNNNTYRSPQALGPLFNVWLSGGNTAYDRNGWVATSGYDVNSNFLTTTGGKPTTNVVFVRPNQYEAGRANIIVYNWQLLGSVSVDLSGVLAVGQRYEIRNVQDWWGSPVVSGTYAGGSVSIPQAAITPPVPVGQDQQRAARPITGPEFNAFVVLRTSP